MKKLFFFLLTLGLALTASHAQTSNTPAAEEAAIKKMIEAENAAFDAADYKAYSSHWAKVPYASYIFNSEKVVGDELWKRMDEVFANHKPTKNNKTRTNWNIRTKGDAAFVTFDQRIENQDNQLVWESVEARYMEKINGQWKIVNTTGVVKPAK